MYLRTRVYNLSFLSQSPCSLTFSLVPRLVSFLLHFLYMFGLSYPFAFLFSSLNLNLFLLIFSYLSLISLLMFLLYLSLLILIYPLLLIVIFLMYLRTLVYYLSFLSQSPCLLTFPLVPRLVPFLCSFLYIFELSYAFAFLFSLLCLFLFLLNFFYLSLIFLLMFLLYLLVLFSIYPLLLIVIYLMYLRTFVYNLSFLSQSPCLLTFPLVPRLIPFLFRFLDMLEPYHYFAFLFSSLNLNLFLLIFSTYP